MMDLNGVSDITIVGSGPAGVFAALALARLGIVPTILDVGIQQDSDPPRIDSNFYQYAGASDVTELLVGRHFEGLYNLNPSNPHVSFNLTVPKNRFVVSQTNRWLPLLQHNMSVVQSLAKGGLANAWGAAAFRYNDRDLASFPIQASDLDPYYDLVTQEIGINGNEDDLTSFYGATNYLQPPVEPPANSSIVLKKYRKRKSYLQRHGVYVGHMRSAILTRDLGERKAHSYLNTDLFASLNCTYSPVYTLDRLIREQKVNYVPGVLVERWSGDTETVHVHGRRIDSGEFVTFNCKTLVLAAGAINSAKTVLCSRDDYTTRLTIADNPVAYIPFLLPGRIGKRLDMGGYGSTAIACVYEFDEFSTHLNAPIFETMTVPRAEFFRHMPFCASTSAWVLKNVLPAMVIMLVYFPSDAIDTGTMRLNSAGQIELFGPQDRAPMDVIKRIIRLNRRLGLFSHHSLADRTIYGGSIHYVGMLPMRDRPTGLYETDRYGQLHGHPNIYVVDGSVLPAVSSKNHTLTIMANSFRIASRIGHTLKS